MDLLIEIRHNGTGGVAAVEAFVETAKIDTSGSRDVKVHFEK